MFHLVAYGGAKQAENHLFIRALAQSPGAIVTKAKNQQDISNAFLQALNVSSADEARRLPTKLLIEANQKIEYSIGGWGKSIKFLCFLSDFMDRTCHRW